MYGRMAKPDCMLQGMAIRFSDHFHSQALHFGRAVSMRVIDQVRAAGHQLAEFNYSR